MARKKKRVLVLVPFPMSGEHLGMREAQSKQIDLGPDLEFSYKPVKWAGTNFVGPYDYVVGDFTMLEAGLQAQEDGFDAVCIDTMSDSGVAALRAVLDIPVIGPGRTTILTAMMLGNKFGMLVMWERWLGLYKKVMDELGVWDKYAGHQSIGMAPDRFSLLGGEERVVFPKLLRAGKKLVEENGADVIILGSTSMHQARDFLAEKLPVPVISPRTDLICRSLDDDQPTAFAKPQILPSSGWPERRLHSRHAGCRSRSGQERPQDRWCGRF